MIRREDRDGVTLLTLEHGKASALDADLCRALSRQLEELESSTRAVVLTGRGSIFSAGVDLFRLTEGGPDYVEEFLPALSSAFHDLFAFPKPVVAAVNGHAIAGGCILTLASDHRLMARGPGKIGMPELMVGVPFPPLAIEVLRFADPQKAQALVLSGRSYGAEEAREQGLIDEVVDAAELLDRALEVAHRLASIPERSYALTKAVLRRPFLDRAERLQAELGPEIAEVWAAPETHEAIRGYLERTLGKRKT